ncbi:hypothetical protein RHSIM_Rhsim13G0226400 [Rhododendron simsii]|uniref:Bromo domain-containing protein n=1 Tax=Rhododendron simsii TaxID=118357 RepID=A0A834L682_RHOSS|nr:hypothetical protein RHSIM_Rhsim13G0226400 [Rhododendron simsii]
MNKDEDEEGTEHHPWGTLEELLLACAVSRHGAKSWDSVATELQKRASSASHQHHHLRTAAVYSPPNCKQRYNDLLSRFSAVDGDDALVDELKKLRVAELRREVERHDVSIELLELKVKRLEEEREQRTEETLKTGGTDLPDHREPEGNSRRERSGSGDDGQSFNESNTTSYQKGENREQNGDEPERSEPVPVREEVKPVEKCSLSLEEETKEENNNNIIIDEVESPSKKKRRRSSGEDEKEGGKLLHAKEIAIKCQPLIKILVMLRSHRNGSLFERRLRSQETDNYKKMIRQHMDLQTVQSRLDRGFYLSSSSSNNNKNSHHKFFRDLLLLYTNAIIFFPTTSPHHVAALELRQLLTKHMPATAPTPKPDPEPKQPDPVHCRTDKHDTKLRQPGNNPVPPKSEPGKKQPVSRQPGTNPVPQKSETSKKEPVSLHLRSNKVGPKLERSEAKPHSNRVSMGSKAVEEKSSKKQPVKERPELSRRSGRVGSGYSEKEKKKTPPKDVEEDSSNIEDSGEKKRRGERGRNNGRGKKGRPPSKSPVGRDVGRGKRGRREGGQPPPVVDSRRPRKRSQSTQSVLALGSTGNIFSLGIITGALEQFF